MIQSTSESSLHDILLCQVYSGTPLANRNTIIASSENAIYIKISTQSYAFGRLPFTFCVLQYFSIKESFLTTPFFYFTLVLNIPHANYIPQTPWWRYFAKVFTCGKLCAFWFIGVNWVFGVRISGRHIITLSDRWIENVAYYYIYYITLGETIAEYQLVQ